LDEGVLGRIIRIIVVDEHLAYMPIHPFLKLVDEQRKSQVAGFLVP